MLKPVAEVAWRRLLIAFASLGRLWKRNDVDPSIAQIAFVRYGWPYFALNFGLIINLARVEKMAWVASAACTVGVSVAATLAYLHILDKRTGSQPSIRAEEEEADFVVIGSGPAGSSFAFTATELGASVVVVERGAYLPRDMTDRSAFPGRVAGSYYRTCLPAFECAVLGGRICAVGGSSALNAGALIQDDEYWEGDWNESGLDDGNWRREYIHDASRRIFEKLGVASHSSPTWAQEFRAACAQAGFRAVDVVRKREEWICGPVRSVLASEARVYASKLLAASRVERAEARCIIMDGKTAVGVQLDSAHIIRARRGVVIAGGAEDSALLLFRSGLSGGIGERYTDHPTVPIPFVAPPPRGHDEPFHSAVAFSDDFQLSYCRGTGLLSAAPKLLSRRPILALVARFVAYCLQFMPDWIAPKTRLGVIFATVSRPETCTQLCYNPRRDCLDVRPPSLHANDAGTLRRAVTTAGAVIARAHPSRLNAMLTWLFTACPVIATIWHAAGGVPRSIALHASDLRLVGTHNVYVVGVAAMPRLTRANPMAACYGMGARLAAIVSPQRRVPAATEGGA